MRTRGFTLIELMIVVAIIGILAAVIIPALNGRKPIGSDYSPEPYNAVPVKTEQFQCVQGILLKVQPNGKQVPATDSQAHVVKC